MAVTTAGVTATARGVYPGQNIIDYTGPREYVQVGTTQVPSWARAGANYAVVPLTATTSTGGGAVASWAPPEGGPILITRALVHYTTKSTGAANLSVGVAANATTSAANLIDTLAIGTTAGPQVYDNVTDGSTNGKARQHMSATQYVTATGSASTAGLVGTLYLEYLKP